jgi:hypothetical protein
MPNKQVGLANLDQIDDFETTGSSRPLLLSGWALRHGATLLNHLI